MTLPPLGLFELARQMLVFQAASSLQGHTAGAQVAAKMSDTFDGLLDAWGLPAFPPDWAGGTAVPPASEVHPTVVAGLLASGTR